MDRLVENKAMREKVERFIGEEIERRKFEEEGEAKVSFANSSLMERGRERGGERTRSLTSLPFLLLFLSPPPLLSP